MKSFALLMMALGAAVAGAFLWAILVVTVLP